MARGTLQTLYENIVSAERDAEAKAQDAKAEDAEAEGGAASEGAAVGATRPAARRFIKAGSSFIVNLDNVRSAGEGSLIFADGETIVVPIRKRKAVKDALDSFLMRS